MERRELQDRVETRKKTTIEGRMNRALKPNEEKNLETDTGATVEALFEEVLDLHNRVEKLEQGGRGRV